VSTQFPKPHGTADITKVAFSPAPASEGSSTTAAQPYLLTASADGTAKLWQVRQVKKTDQGEFNLPTHATFSTLHDDKTSYITFTA